MRHTFEKSDVNKAQLTNFPLGATIRKQQKQKQQIFNGDKVFKSNGTVMKNKLQ